MGNANSYILRHPGDQTTALCSKCGHEKLPSDFYTHSTRGDGAVRYRSICKKCRCVGGRKHWSRPVHSEIIKSNKQTCSVCKAEKPLSGFYSNGCFADGVKKYRTRCIECVLVLAKESQPKVYAKKSEIRSKSPRTYLSGLLNHASARKKKLGFNLDLEFLCKLYEKQSGKCAISGMMMTHQAGKGRLMQNMSLDRIDSAKGYTKDNVQIVCLAANLMKQSMSADELLNWCKEIVKNAKNKTQNSSLG